MRDTIKFEYNKKEFEIYVEPTYLELQKIENIAASLFGGIVEYKKAMQQLRELRSSLGEPNFENIQNNPYGFGIFFDVQNTIGRAYLYSKLKILLINPPVDIDTLSKEQLDDIISAYEVALVPFRGGKEEIRKVS